LNLSATLGHLEMFRATFLAYSVHGSLVDASSGRQTVARVIDNAIAVARPGDVLLLEQQRQWSRLPQRPNLPIEWWPVDFAAIQRATAKGMVVIEAAGNGAFLVEYPDGKNEKTQRQGQFLDSADLALTRNIPKPDGDDQNDPDSIGNIPLFPNPFLPNVVNPRQSDSGAVLVGAGASSLERGAPAPGERYRLISSSFGSRVDVQAWGENVFAPVIDITDDQGRHTFCNAVPDGSPLQNDNQCYMTFFSGTSSASAIIAGFVASVQGILKAQNLRTLNSREWNVLLRDPTTGWAQLSGPATLSTENIGARPDMRLLIPNAIAMATFPPLV
jgi:hypothetical protein